MLQGCKSDGVLSSKEQGGVTGNVIYLPATGLLPLPLFPAELLNDPGLVISDFELGNITSTTYNFPKDSKYQDSNGRYHYIVDSIQLDGSNISQIQNQGGSGGNNSSPSQDGSGGAQSKVLKISDKTTLYLRGEIDIKGNRTIENTGDISDLQIYGGDGKTGGVYANKQTSKVCISGNSQIKNAFILAPEASAGLNGGGSAQPNFRGRVWVKDLGSAQDAIQVPIRRL